MGKRIGTTGLVTHNDKFEGIYRGTVMDNNDPDQLGRIKAKIYPMLEGVSTESLPWAVPASPLFEGAGADMGCFTVPQINANVFVFFEMGDIYQPVYFAEAQDRLKGLPTERTTNYPNNKVLKTASGIVINLDETDSIIKIITPNGLELLIDDGNKVIQGKSQTDFHFRIDEPSKYIEMKTANGIIWRLSDDDSTATMTHPSGAYLTLDQAGNWFIKGTTIQLNPV